MNPIISIMHFTPLNPMLRVLIALFFIIVQFTATANMILDQNSSTQDYPNHKQLSHRLDNMAKSHPNLAKLQSLTKTKGDKDIWMLSIGKGDIDNKPAIAIVGGVEGDHLLGSELALQFAEKLLQRSQSAEINDLLESVSFYVFPDVSPDAREQYFAPLRYERRGNANPTDLDRDGRIGEDPYNDLNKDGKISMMRVKDASGAWMKHPDDGRIMVKARAEKGEKGEYMLFSEGIDQDKDGQFNEDGEEGVFFNRNFTFKYPAFTSGAGEHAVSEKETRAIADFLFEAKNIFLVISFGPANNLSTPLTYNDKEARGRIHTGWMENDVQINQIVSSLYNKHLAQHTPKANQGTDGDFFQWAYFHYGRFSFSTQGWTPPEQAKSESDAIASDALSFLRWAEEKELPNVFVPWVDVDHPDFKGKQVEVGGIAPFVMNNPPYSLVDSIAEMHTAFMLDLAAMAPNIDIINLETEKLGAKLYRVTADIINTGAFPTVSETGTRLRWVQNTVLRITPANNQKMISGKTIEVIGSIEGHGSVQRSWLIHGDGTLNMRVGAKSTGFKEVQVKL